MLRSKTTIIPRVNSNSSASSSSSTTSSLSLNSKLHHKQPNSSTFNSQQNINPSVSFSLLNKRNIANFKHQAEKGLDDIVDTRKLVQNTPGDISTIWHEYHKHMVSYIADVIPASTWQNISSRSSKCPMFVIPVNRNIGYQNMVAQFQGNRCLIASLREYQENGDSTMPHLTLTHYTDLVSTKGIILMRGDVNTSHLNKGEAEEITRSLYRFYLHPKLFPLVEKFNLNPNQFDINEVVGAVYQMDKARGKSPPPPKE
eukprot:gb/GECH01013801.1/.p1 GENE.gb/GECH01013801.1/~~gb/GECH01013801.1/.p1  ORF type:complete len:257 (+),score=54.81 gb/GECH01013801.1/:1-771(+)